jgi:hypothetical protein
MGLFFHSLDKKGRCNKKTTHVGIEVSGLQVKPV